jgi:hypothetical protein
MDYEIIFDTIQKTLNSKKAPQRDLSKLVYCSSLDHLNWYLPSQTWKYKFHFDKDEFIKAPSRRIEISHWITDYCDGPVYVWNHCQRPHVGQTDYADLISPSGEATLYFSQTTDYAQFVLRYGN